MRTLTFLLLAVAVAQCSAFHETFSEGWESRWIHATDSKYGGKFVVESPLKELDDPAVKVPEKAQHYGLTTVLPTPVDPSSEPLVLQFDLKLADGLTCGGAYMKFVTADSTFKAAALKDDTPYTVMFGPDRCGGTNKVHLILRHQNQKTKEIEEKHLKSPPSVLTDDATHVYTAILFPANNSYAVLVDGEEKKAGSLFEDFDPSIVPSAEIDDPEDKKPSDWVDEARIADPAAKKPDDWDEDAPQFIPDEDAEKPEGWLDDEPTEIDDPEATQPDDWDDEEDGDWEAPKIANPKCKEAPGCGEWTRPTKPNPDYKGKWTAPYIDNPKYKGPWAPRKIANPSFHNDTKPLSHIGKVGGVAIEIWTMDSNYFFDNVVVSNSPEEAATIRETTWATKRVVEKEIAEKREAEAKEKAEKEKASSEGGFVATVSKSVSGTLQALFDAPALAPVMSLVPAGVKTAIVDNSLAVVAIFSALAALVLTPRVMAVAQKQAGAVAAGQAKKNDDAQPAGSALGKKAANGKKNEEITEADEQKEEDEDEGEDASPSKAGVRRRARRD